MTEKIQLYHPPEFAQQILTRSRILAPGETPQKMFDRVVSSLFSIESRFGTPPDQVESLKTRFAELMAGNFLLPGSPTLTNAGRREYEEAPLSSCSLIPVDLNQRVEAAKTIRAYYQQNINLPTVQWWTLANYYK